MSTMEIITNLNPRPIIYGWDLSEDEKKEFDYMEENELLDSSFVRYLGEVYSLGDFMRIEHRAPDPMKGWDGYHCDTYFSGILIKLSEDGEEVVMGRYFS